MSNEKTVKKDLLTGPLLPKIILFTLPLIATGILQLLFNTADTVVVGRWGGATAEERETALAAVGSCGALINLIVNLFFGISVGAGVLTAQSIGAGLYEKVERVVHTSVLTALIAGTLVGAIGFSFARLFLTLMGTDPAVLDQAVPYMKAYFLGAPANMVYNYCAAILRANGDTVHPLKFLSFAGVLNVFLNLAMVLIFGLGAVGVGIATAVSQWTSCILILVFMCRQKDVCHLNLKKIRICPDELGVMLRIGIPAGIQGSVFSISNVLIQSSVNSFGKATVAANAAASNIGDYAYTAENALHHTTLTFVGQHLGAKKWDRLKKSILICAACVTVVGLAVGLIELLFGRPLLSLFIPGNEQAIEIGMRRLRILLPTYFLCGLMDVFSGVLRGFGHSGLSTIISLTGACLLRIVWILTVFNAFRSLECLYVSYPISWLLTTAVEVVFAVFIFKKSKKTLENLKSSFTKI